ncbi:glutathione S-transferase [Paucibacter sp. R3-3]|uniref:Glutathione S-transferase n=1 Tax=Roseateles agri TaxID=3098619 RepID=A0ABU5DFJ2_9BURK|nr:glutathione S-transferase [Paucibacter sp. R3-3]MDY0744894.1 glutathione S-transferase [Paucibacter sp. R3-3]
MEMTLYGTRGSGSAAIEAALVLAGQPFTQVDAASWVPGAGLDALAKINPLRQIPTLVLADGSVMTESAAILIHLGLSLPDGTLLPQSPSARAQAIRGLVFIAANCYAAISVLDFPERWSLDADSPPDVERCIKRGARHRLHLHWEMFADQFLVSPEPFLNGAAPGALDLLAAVVSRWSGARQHLKAARPDFHALLCRVDTHPPLAALFEHHWPARAA